MKASGCDNETATTITFCYTVYDFLVDLEDQCQYGHCQSVRCPAVTCGDMHDQLSDLQGPSAQVYTQRYLENPENVRQHKVGPQQDAYEALHRESSWQSVRCPAVTCGDMHDQLSDIQGLLPRYIRRFWPWRPAGPRR